MDIQRIKDQLRALSKLTVEAGATEAEALAAAERMAALLDKHGLSQADVEAHKADASKADIGQATYGDRKRMHEVQQVAMAIARLFDVIVWHCQTRDENGVGARLTYFGYPQDVAAAVELTGIIQNAMEAEWKAWYYGTREFIPGAEKSGRTYRAAFMAGMARRLNERLAEMKKARNTAPTTGTALVVVKGQVVARALKATGVRLRAASYSTGGRGDAGASIAGRAAADRVGLSAGKGVGGQAKRITG